MAQTGEVVDVIEEAAAATLSWNPLGLSLFRYATATSRYNPIRPTTTMVARSALPDNRRP